MNDVSRRALLATGIATGAVAVAGKSAQAREVMPKPAIAPAKIRKIKEELYTDKTYDAIWYLANCGFVIRIAGTYIFIDPVLRLNNPEFIDLRNRAIAAGGYDMEDRHYPPEELYVQAPDLCLLGAEVLKADYVLLSHEHTDHFDQRSLKDIAHHHPTVVAPKSCHEGLTRAGVGQNRIVEAQYGSKLKFENCTVEVIYAEHSPGACGFLIGTKYGNFYYPGDTRSAGMFDDPHRETILNLKVDYFLIPINNTGMGVGYAALLTQILQPKVVIPCHYGFYYPPMRSQGGHPAEFVTAIAARNYMLGNTDIVILKPGGKYVLG